MLMQGLQVDVIRGVHDVWSLCRQLAKRTEGQDLVEYAILTGLVSLVSVVSVGLLGVSVAVVFDMVAGQLQ